MAESFSSDDGPIEEQFPNSRVADNTPAELSMGWLLPLLLLVLAAGLFFYFLNGSRSSGTHIAPQFITPPSDTVVHKKAPVLPDSAK